MIMYELLIYVFLDTSLFRTSIAKYPTSNRGQAIDLSLSFCPSLSIV